MKGISKSYSKVIKFDEYKKPLEGKDYQQQCDKYLLRSNIHETYLQKLTKKSFSFLDDRRCHENIIKSKPWNYY